MNATKRQMELTVTTIVTRKQFKDAAQRLSRQTALSTGPEDSLAEDSSDDYRCRSCHQPMFVPDGMEPLESDVRFCDSCAAGEIERLQAFRDAVLDSIIGNAGNETDPFAYIPRRRWDEIKACLPVTRAQS